MEQQNGNSSVQNFEKNLGGNVVALRALLNTHEKTIASIRHDYELERNNADTKLQRSTQDAKIKLNNEVANTSSSYRSRIDALESQFASKKSAELSSSNSIKESSNNKISALLKLRSEWAEFIDHIRADFDKEIDDVRKLRTSDLQKEWENLNKRKNQSTLGEKGHAKYDRESPFIYALFHPFSNVPEWLFGLRTLVIIVAMLWIAILVGMCMWDAYWYREADTFFSSNAVRYFFFTLAVYIVIAFLCCFIAAITAVVKENKKKKSQSESMNDRIISDKADAAKRLERFEQRYKPIYFHDGKWDWDWHRYPMSKEEIEEAEYQTSMVAELYKPAIPSEFSKLPTYSLEVNYNAI